MKSIPMILRLTLEHRYVASISPPSELISSFFLKSCLGMLCFSTNILVLKECDAPVLNNTKSTIELIRNVPSTRFGSS
jgi:hypothetical protein